MKKKEPLSPKEEIFCRFFVASREPRASAARDAHIGLSNSLYLLNHSIFLKVSSGSIRMSALAILFEQLYAEECQQSQRHYPHQIRQKCRRSEHHIAEEASHVAH